MHLSSPHTFFNLSINMNIKLYVIFLPVFFMSLGADCKGRNPFGMSENGITGG
jgi:hypothetical protein